MPSILKTDSACSSQTVQTIRFSAKFGDSLVQSSVIGLVARVIENFPVPDRASSIYDENGAPGDVFQPDHVGVDDAVGVDDVLVVIAQQRKSQLQLIIPCLQRKKRVGADPEDLRPH